MRRTPRLVISAAWLAGLCLSTPASASDPVPARSLVTAAASSSEEVELAFERYTLDNGLEVILHHDPRAPLVAVNLWYHVGSGDEDPGRSGFAHLFEHMMFQGAKHIGEDVHFDLLREIGATGINGTTNRDRTNYYEVVPSHHLETALWLESDRMGYMLDLLSEASFANQRDVVRNERRQNYDDRAYGRERFAVAAALYPEGHPYRYLTIGRHEDLEAASLAEVQRFFLKWYVPSNATLTLAGDFEPAAAKAAIEKWFGSFPRLPKPAHRDVEPPRLEKTTRVEVRDPFAGFERIHLTWLSPGYLHEGDLELDVAAQALSATGWGRLYRRLVLEEKLARAVGAWQGGAQRNGEFNITVTLRPGIEGARDRAIAIVDEELARLRKEGVSAEELRRFQIGREAGFVFGLESLNGRANSLQSYNHYKGDPGYFRTQLQQIRALTPEAVRSATAKWVDGPRAEVITVPGREAGADEDGAASSDEETEG